MPLNVGGDDKIKNKCLRRPAAGPAAFAGV